MLEQSFNAGLGRNEPYRMGSIIMGAMQQQSYLSCSDPANNKKKMHYLVHVFDVHCENSLQILWEVHFKLTTPYTLVSSNSQGFGGSVLCQPKKRTESFGLKVADVGKFWVQHLWEYVY
jgi:hypothetical protein